MSAAVAARFEIGLPAVAISRDGRRMIYAIRDPDGVRRLYLRELGQDERNRTR